MSSASSIIPSYVNGNGHLHLATHLSLAILVPPANGSPGEGYPWHWSVYRWLDGENAMIERIEDPCQAARELARFITALQGNNPTGGPSPGQHNFFRGVPLAAREASTRAAIVESPKSCRGQILDARFRIYPARQA